MTWYAVYNQEDGRLFSLATEISSPLPSEMGVTECGEECPTAAHWDAETRSFVHSSEE